MDMSINFEAHFISCSNLYHHLEIGELKKKASMKHVLKIEEAQRHHGDGLFVKVIGEKWVELYFNMTGYVGALPLASGAKFSPSERGIST